MLGYLEAVWKTCFSNSLERKVSKTSLRHLSDETFRSAQVCESPYDFTPSQYKTLDRFQEHNKPADSHSIDRKRSFCRRTVLLLRNDSLSWLRHIANRANRPSTRRHDFWRSSSFPCRLLLYNGTFVGSERLN